MAHLAQWPERLHDCATWWTTTEPLAAYSLGENCVDLLHFRCCDCSASFTPLMAVPVHHFVFVVFLDIVLFSVSVSLPQRVSLSLSFFLFLSASPPLLCQHFTLDIQLLAGHSIVIPFRAAPFSAGLKQPFKLHPRLPSELPLCKMLFSNISGATT